MRKGPDAENHLLDKGLVFPSGKRRDVGVHLVPVDQLCEERVSTSGVFDEKDFVARPRVVPFETADRAHVTPPALCRFLCAVEFAHLVVVNLLRPRRN